MKRTRWMWPLGGVLLGGLLLLLQGCAAEPRMVAPSAAQKNPVEQVAGLEKVLAAARDKDLHVLAPTRFSQAQKLLEEARRELAEEASMGDILLKVSSSRAHLQLAEESAEIARTALAGVIQARDLARKAGAESLGKPYAEVEDRFIDLTRAIEKDKLGWAQKKEPEVSRQYDALELQAITEKALGQARGMLAQARSLGAENKVPVTYAAAAKTFEEAENYIAKNRYRSQEIELRSDQSLFHCRRLLAVLEESERLKKMSPEELALWGEGMLIRSSAALDAPDRRDELFRDQEKAILAEITALRQSRKELGARLAARQAEAESYNARIAQLEGNTLEERREVERLAAERRFEERFDEVQGYFEPGEAEVYKQGNRLIVRLKGMAFPVGEAYIQPANYGMLGKLQRAMRLFSDSNILIEGHTDSTGLESNNLKLSQRRAESVRQYLLANGTVAESHLVAVGYGSQKPLASNATAEGRALNRRIDVVFTPR